MTLPWQHNCEHLPDGVCIACVGKYLHPAPDAHTDARGEQPKGKYKDQLIEELDSKQQSVGFEEWWGNQPTRETAKMFKEGAMEIWDAAYAAGVASKEKK